MDQFISLLIHIFPNYATYLTYAGLYAWISGGTAIIRQLWTQWAVYRNYAQTDLSNRSLVGVTVLLAIIAPLIALIITGQITNYDVVWKAARMTGLVLLGSHGIYTISHHSNLSPLDILNMILGKSE